MKGLSLHGRREMGNWEVMVHRHFRHSSAPAHMSLLRSCPRQATEVRHCVWSKYNICTVTTGTLLVLHWGHWGTSHFPWKEGGKWKVKLVKILTGRQIIAYCYRPVLHVYNDKEYWYLPLKHFVGSLFDVIASNLSHKTLSLCKSTILLVYKR